MQNIKIFVSCHFETLVPDVDFLYPVHAGAALSKEHFNGFLEDNTGDNISEKNRSYCELTVLYWAWKNVVADYYGLFHYRRYLYPGVNSTRPYKIVGPPEKELLLKYGYGDFDRLIEQYDLIVTVPEQMYVSVREHYAEAKHHHVKDLEAVEEIIKEKTPWMCEAMVEYLEGTKSYFGNIFIAKKAVLDEYCKWLFDVLDEFDRRADVNGYGVQEKRVNGYLAERLLGIYCTYVFQQGDKKVLQLPRMHFETNRTVKSTVNKVAYYLLPPGSVRRSVIKKMVKKIGSNYRKQN